MNYLELVDYYDRELAYLRKSGVDFARRYPRIAQRLELAATGSTDPHVERLLEGFAFLTARIQRKIDDEFPEISEALLSVMQPHLLAPLPSMGMLQMHLDPSKGRGTHAQVIPRETLVYARAGDGIQCRFSTCYRTELWPLAVSSVRMHTPRAGAELPIKAAQQLSITLRTQASIGMQELSLTQLSFYLHGAPRSSYALHEFILNQVQWVELVDPAQNDRVLFAAPATELIRPVGYEPEHGLLPYGPRTLLGYRLLLEYFALPQKFLFFSLQGLENAVTQCRGQELRIQLYSELPYQGTAEAVDANSFQLGVTPIVNLFKKTAETITIKRLQSEYLILPDKFQFRNLEVYGIERVRGYSLARTDERLYLPFYSVSHDNRLERKGRAYWYARRRDIIREQEQGSELYLSFTDLEFSALAPSSEVLLVEILCTNRDLPASLPFGEQSDDFSLEGAPIRSTQTLIKPTPVRRLTRGKGLQWRLISHLSLNFAALNHPEHGVEALKELLRLYDFHESEVTEQQISGIVKLDCHPAVSRIESPNGETALARGFDMVLELDPNHYVGSGPFLFASVLERFLGLYVSMNSFIRLSVTLKGKEGVLKRWKPRAGTQTLL